MLLKIPALQVSGAALVPASVGLMSALSGLDRFGKKYELYKLQGNSMLIPRGLADIHPTTHDYMADGEWEGEIGVCAIQPKDDDQKKVYAEALARVKAGRSFIAECPTGWGKTYLGAYLGFCSGRRVLVVCTKTDLMQSWKIAILAAGVPENQIGIAQAGKLKYEGCRFVLGMVNSLAMKDYPADFWHHFGMVLFDETHRMGADTFSEVCWRIPARIRVGLSATPKRSDGRDKVFRHHIGDVEVKGAIVPMKPKILIKKTGWKVPQMSVYNPVIGTTEMKPMPVTPGQLGAVTKAMENSLKRNLEIVKFVRACVDKGRWALILSHTVHHLEILEKLLVQGGVPPTEISYYIGGLSSAEYEIAKTKRVVLATYAYTKEGTNVPHWDSLVMATPLAKCKQAIGRVMREHPGKPTPAVLDLVDDHPVFASYAKSRLTEYYSVGATLVYMQ